MQPPPDALPALPPARKAAVIVRLALGEGVTLPIDTLPEALQARLAREMAQTRFVDGATLERVVAEFADRIEDGGLAFPGGVDGALNLLEGQISARAAADLRGEGGACDPWKRIAGLDEAELVALIDAEGAEVAAVVLSKLSHPKAAAILGRLPGARARQIALAVSRTSQIGPDTVARIGAALSEALDAAPRPAFTEPPEERMGAILNVAQALTREELLAGLDAADSALAERVRRAIFTFEHIPDRLSPRDVPMLARNVPQEVLVTALSGALAGRDDSKAAAGFILSNLSHRLADQLREEIEERGPVKPRVAEDAMLRLVTSLREQAEAGDIVLSEGAAAGR
ncbi:flagellar motor switch protein FliG [Rhodovulum iodosum]|uniref:Flagellar motor switch protein FliG n=1 Tax=Rhodovulum iodosum TaxID=68291 RepID=A0ABV3XVF1_9RHOB|nr:FliG C-terminal domain-containing protein [Rhodovulum robiginosum]RSK33507.1 flagellar motor switch protein FliG [Rhodovulum robiginosum]